MAKGQNLSRHQAGIVKRYYDNQDTITLQKLAEIVSDLYVTGPTTTAARKLWERAALALMKTQVDPTRMAKLLKDRNVEALAGLITELSKAPPSKSPAAHPAPPSNAPAPVASSPQEPQAPQAPPSSAPTAEELKHALKAFRKRLKLSRLDAESGLSRSPLSSGKSAGIVAIQPPREFPAAVWEELVRQGRLKPAGRGFYQLV